MNFHRPLMAWYQIHKRDLPWRKTANPYLIWISEIILQQTRVEQGLDYYNRFTARFPDIRSLAKAEEEEVMKAWQGLGYYSRARNLHHTAKILHGDYNSQFPASYEDMIKLKGIGDYSASAISSIVFNEVRPVIDGNVIRVVSRFAGIKEPVGTTDAKKKIREFLNKNIDKDDPGTFNQAVMELGALVCKPKSPGCKHCPVAGSCFANKEGLTDILPNKVKGKLQETRFLNYLFIFSIQDEEVYIWIRKRTSQDIWKNLYEFPLIETSTQCSPDELITTADWELIRGNHNFNIRRVIEVAPYKLTHRQLIVRFLVIRSDEFSSPDYLKIKFNDHHKYPVSRLIENFLKKVESGPGIFLNFPD